MSRTSKFIERFDLDLSSPELLESNSTMYSSSRFTVSDLSLNNTHGETYLSTSPTSIKHDDNFTARIKHFLSNTLSRKRNRYSTHSSSSTNSSCSTTGPHSL